jgi:hypothetical protein
MSLAASLILVAAAASSISIPAQADPYRWCAEYGSGRSGGGTNCYFVTLNQCRAAISGVGGFCRRNNFYDGRPQRTPEDAYGMHRWRDRGGRW